MREQIGTVLRRLSGETEKPPPVLSFITQFGGGKTHTLTALWHLARLGPSAAHLPGVPDLLAHAHLPAVPHARLGVFVGNAWDPQPARAKPPGSISPSSSAVTAGIAALGNAASSSPPGTEALTRLFAAAGGPVLVLMDEVLNFINRHRSLADPFYAFLDNLVRAATGTRHVAVVLSLPKSAVEMTPLRARLAGPHHENRQARRPRPDRQRRIRGQRSRPSPPVRGPRPRTHPRPGRQNLRRLVLRAPRRAAAAMDRGRSNPRPNAARARCLRDRFAACYPFHPATLSVFQRKWQSLPQYQQTRGTLGMLAQWLSYVYQDSYTKARTSR